MGTPINRREFTKILSLAAGSLLAPEIIHAAPSNDKAEALKGFVVSDAHFGWNYRTQPLPEEQQKAMAHILSRFPDLDLFIDTGDAHHGDGPDNKDPDRARKDWVDIIQGGCGSVPFYYVLGNHEIRSNDEADPEMRCNIMGSTTCRPYYSFDVKGIHFVSLPELIRAINITDEEWDWLELDLALNRDKSCILLSHNNVLGTTTGNEPGYRGLLESERMLRVFQEHPNVIAWMHGHNHNFEIVNQQNMLFVSNGRIGGFDPSYGKHGIGGIYFEVTAEGLTAKCYSAEKKCFLDTLDPSLTQTLNRETSFNAEAEYAYSYGVGGAVNGERIPAYHHHVGEDVTTELFMTGCDNAVINDDPGMTKYAERRLRNGLDKILLSAAVSRGDAGYEYLNPGIRVKNDDTEPSMVTMPSDNFGGFTYYRCPPGRHYKVSVDLRADKKAERKAILRLHVHDIQGRKLCSCESEPVSLEKGRQKLERLIEVPEIDNIETIYNNPDSENLVNISIEVSFTGMKRDIDIFSITMEQQNDSQNTNDAGVVIEGQAHTIQGALEKGKIARVPVHGLRNARSVNEIIAGGNRRLTYLIRHSNLKWQVRNATARWNGHCFEIGKVRNIFSDKGEVVITPLGEYPNPYLHRVRKAEQIRYYPFNAQEKTLTVEIGEVSPGADMVLISGQSPESVAGTDTWNYDNNLITVKLDSPGTITFKY